MPVDPVFRLTGLFRYPVKGLSAEAMDRVRVASGAGIPGDRAYAIENGPSGFNPLAPRFFQKAAFLMLMRNGSLASLAARFDHESRVLTISRQGRLLAEGDLDTVNGRQAIEAFFDDFAASELRGPTKILAAPGHSFADCGAPFVSLINLASLDAIADLVGVPVHPLRFRGNLYVEGLPAWGEFDLVGTRLRVGDIVFEAVERINRCAAINVNPQTAARDLALPRTLLEELGHADCGIYLKVVDGGEMATGDPAFPG